jgi:co-chaperonin GroES (HSP10)
MLNNVTKKVICISCLKHDEEMFKKYYGDEMGDDDEDHYIIELT